MSTVELESNNQSANRAKYNGLITELGSDERKIVLKAN